MFTLTVTHAGYSKVVFADEQRGKVVDYAQTRFDRFTRTVSCDFIAAPSIGWWWYKSVDPQPLESEYHIKETIS